MVSSTVDVNIPRFNQTIVAAVTAVAFLVQAPVLVGLTFLILAVSWAGGPRFAPLTRIYTGLVRPRLQPDGPHEFEPAGPPRFAQMLGAVFLGGGYLLLIVGWTTAGWALTLVVTALATLAATTRICVGCIIYERAVAK